MLSKITRDHGMDWDEILEYEVLIHKIVTKYTSDPHLREDVISEVILALYEDRRLDTSKFLKKDAAIRNTIRNKTLKILRCKKRGRQPSFLESLENLAHLGMEVNTFGEWSTSVLSKRKLLDFYDPNEA